MFSSWRPAATRAPALGLALSLACALPAAAVPALDTAELTELEGLLRDLGFDPGKVDGVVDADTIEAIRRYQDFALLPGEPEPSALLLDELRGVAAAFAALNAGKEKPAAPPPAEDTTPQPETAPETVAEKVVVPPPPAPPKLMPPEESPPPTQESAPQESATEEQATEERAAEEAPPAEAAPPEPAPQLAELPPANATPTPVTEPPPESVNETQAHIDAELAPYKKQLQDGSLTREALARKLNDEGRKLLQQANYDAAILKFSVAIQLDPKFAGAYSNRGTAYQRRDEPELAKADFDKARQLGFGGVRLGDSANPLK